MSVLQHYSVHAFDMSTIIVFVYLGLQVKWNQFSSNNSYHTSCVHKGSHAWKWPDLMTSKPDSVTTLGNHWTDHTGRPLEPQVHWLICIIGTHWKTTGSTLATSNFSPVAFRCTLGSKFQAHWIATGLPLEDHWLGVIFSPFYQCWLTNPAAPLSR